MGESLVMGDELTEPAFFLFKPLKPVMGGIREVFLPVDKKAFNPLLL